MIDKITAAREETSPRAEGGLKFTLPKLGRKPELKKQVGLKPPAPEEIDEVEAHSFLVTWMCWNCAKINRIPSNWSSFVCWNPQCHAFCSVEPASDD
jgi:hypothetical protein